MIGFNIDKEYTLKENYAEITLNDMIQISKLGVSDFSLEFSEDYAIDDIISVLSILSTAPREVLENTDPYHLYVLFDMIKENIINLHKWELNDILPVHIVQYNYKGNIYYFPEYLTLGEENILAHKEASKYVIEANNLLRYISKEKLSGIEKMKYVCALCMKEDINEEYDDKMISDRAEYFKDLPMYIVIQVFFFIISFLSKYLKDSLSYSVRGEKEKKIRIVRGFIQLHKKVLQEVLKMWKKYIYGNLLKFYLFLFNRKKTTKNDG